MQDECSNAVQAWLVYPPVSKLISNLVSGVVKTYRLTYEDAEGIYVQFDREGASNHWQIESGMLKEYIEHFGPKADQLDICVEEDRAIFTSFTEKLMNGDGE